MEAFKRDTTEEDSQLPTPATYHVPRTMFHLQKQRKLVSIRQSFEVLDMVSQMLVRIHVPPEYRVPRT